MKRFLLFAVLLMLLLSAFAFAGHTRPGQGPSHECTCSTITEPCFDDGSDVPLPLCK